MRSSRRPAAGDRQPRALRQQRRWSSTRPCRPRSRPTGRDGPAPIMLVSSPSASRTATSCSWGEARDPSTKCGRSSRTPSCWPSSRPSVCRSLGGLIVSRSTSRRIHAFGRPVSRSCWAHSTSACRSTSAADDFDRLSGHREHDAGRDRAARGGGKGGGRCRGPRPADAFDSASRPAGAHGQRSHGPKAKTALQKALGDVDAVADDCPGPDADRRGGAEPPPRQFRPDQP